MSRKNYAEKYIEDSASNIKRELLGLLFISIAFVALVVELILTPNILGSIKKEDVKNYEVSEIHLQISSVEYEGFNGSDYVSKVRITVKNNCDIGLTIVSGSMKIEDVNNHKILWNGKFDLEGEVASGGTGTWDIIIKSNQNDLSTYTLDKLNIYTKIEFAQFSNYVYKNYNNNEFIKINAGTVSNTGNSDGQGTNNDSTNDTETKYQNAINLYNSGNYTQAKAIFVSLGNYKDSQNYVALCEEKAYYVQLEKDLHDVVGYDAILPDNYTRVNSVRT